MNKDSNDQIIIHVFHSQFTNVFMSYSFQEFKNPALFILNGISVSTCISKLHWEIDYGQIVIKFHRNMAKETLGVCKTSSHSLSKISIFMKVRTLLILQGKHRDQLLVNQSDFFKQT